MTQSLSGLRVVVTRPQDQSEVLCDRLRALGAEPIVFPVIAIVPPEPGGPLDQAIARLAGYDWIIFTSVNGVKHFWARLEARGGDQPARLSFLVSCQVFVIYADDPVRAGV